MNRLSKTKVSALIDYLITLSRKNKQKVLAVMGDGINDVSAINVTEVAISVENPVDVAREAADVVLMKKNLTLNWY
ncbi:HAD hydrolase family protein [Arcicella rosea]|uniref:P-type E1-E2 ATPase n=1 Tax=Arcicella rosea TaxID=502909 RepID=A0A841EUI0_9BACT|nr:HAD hydrolase family protein [Arcicella rosea]MBB6005039.1 P-type E1-E2 ATPase [Arcicella rosea]